MKIKISLLYLVFFAAIILSACKKVETFNEEKVKKETIYRATDISGNWKWLFSVTGGNPNSEGYLKNPGNTGDSVLLILNSDKRWSKSQNKIKTDSGNYSIGHGIYTPYVGTHVFSYDSIIYSNTVTNTKSVDFYKRFHDTLIFSGLFRGYATKSDPTEGATKYYIRVK
jgi:hypothetical protein